MKDLAATMDIAMEGEEGEGEAAPPQEDDEFPGTAEAMKESMKEKENRESFTGSASVPPPPTVVVDDEKAKIPSATSTPPPRSEATSPTPSFGSRNRIPIRAALTDKAHEDMENEVGTTEEDLKGKERKKGGMSKEQREKLLAYEKERARIRKERVEALTRKLLDRVSVWTETDKGADVTRAFQEKMRLEVENLKMESFGIDILHAIGQTYMSKASTLLRSQKFLGIGGFFSKLKDKGTLVKDTWNTISSAIDAQQTVEDMAKMEERGGEDWTEEKRVEYERRVTGKILTAAWRGSRFEIQGVLREVCDTVLNDKKVPLSKRLERAQALVLIGEIFLKVRGVYSLPSFGNEAFKGYRCSNCDSFYRPNVLPKKKAIICSLSSSSPKQPSRRIRMSTSTRRTRSPRLQRRLLRMPPTCPNRRLRHKMYSLRTWRLMVRGGRTGDVRRENGKLRICLFREIMSRLPDRERSAYLLYRVYNPLLFFFLSGDFCHVICMFGRFLLLGYSSHQSKQFSHKHQKKKLRPWKA